MTIPYHYFLSIFTRYFLSILFSHLLLIPLVLAIFSSHTCFNFALYFLSPLSTIPLLVLCTFSIHLSLHSLSTFYTFFTFSLYLLFPFFHSLSSFLLHFIPLFSIFIDYFFTTFSLCFFLYILAPLSFLVSLCSFSINS